MAGTDDVVVPKNFGLTYDPPSLTLVYQVDKKLREPRTSPVSSIRPHLPCLTGPRRSLAQANARCPCGSCTPRPIQTRWRSSSRRPILRCLGRTSCRINR